MYWLRWHHHVKDISGAPYKIKKKSKQKRQNRRQSVVAGRQQLYCAVQSRSPNHCQTTTGKVQRRCIPDRRWQKDSARRFVLLMLTTDRHKATLGPLCDSRATCYTHRLIIDMLQTPIAFDSTLLVDISSWACSLIWNCRNGDRDKHLHVQKR